MPRKKKHTLIDSLVTAAATHGQESDPDHEVGDLQLILYSCWRRLTPAQQREVYAEHKQLVDDWS